MTRFAYADPPYLGLAARFYGRLHPEAAAYDDPETHRGLIDRLVEEFDGWALSLHTPSLRTLLPMTPEDVRVCAWVKPFAVFKPNVPQAFAWEPILVRPVRRRPIADPTIRDWISTPITLRRGLTGAKPEALARWMFEFAGLEPEDEFVDLFPGTGGVGRAWDAWRSQTRLGLAR